MLDDKKQRDLIALIRKMHVILQDNKSELKIDKETNLKIDKETNLSGYDIISMIQLLHLTLKNLDERAEVFIFPGENLHCTDFHYNVIAKTLEMFTEQSLDILNNSGFNRLSARYMEHLIKATCEYFDMEYDDIKQNIIDMLEYCEQVLDNHWSGHSEVRVHLNELYAYLDKGIYK